MIRSKLFHTLYYRTRVRHTKSTFFNSPKGRRRIQSREHKLSGVWTPVPYSSLIVSCTNCTTRTTSNAHESVLSVKLLPRHTVIHWRNKSKKHHIRQKAPRAVIWIHQARYHTIPETRSPFCRRNGTRLKSGLLSSIRLESPEGLPHRLRLVDLARLWI